MPKALYICYFGIHAPLVQTQVLPYLRELMKGDYPNGELKVSILTFEPDPPTNTDELRTQLAEEGIDWHWLPYHRRFSVIATAWDILRGTIFVRRLIQTQKVDILHGRVHVPTLMGALARMFSRHKPKLLFDIRGFFPEEYTDAGVWPADGLIYRVVKRVESWLLKDADGFVVLTEKARDILFPEAADNGRDSRGRPVEVIPCCVDISRFSLASEQSRQEIRRNLSLEGRFVMAYVGSFGGWYLTNETADFFGELKRHRSDAFALVVTQSNPEVLGSMLRERGYDPSDYYIRSVPPAQLPHYLSGADAAVSFIKRCYSKQASSPTKNAEYLACGLPIVANEGIGDVDKLITLEGGGVLLSEFSERGYKTAIVELEKLGRDKSYYRLIASTQFDLGRIGGERYRRIYRRMLGGPEKT